MPLYIRVRWFKTWSVGGGFWSVRIERATDSVPLTRPLSYFLNDKTWNHFEHFPTESVINGKTI